MSEYVRGFQLRRDSNWSAQDSTFYSLRSLLLNDEDEVTFKTYTNFPDLLFVFVADRTVFDTTVFADRSSQDKLSRKAEKLMAELDRSGRYDWLLSKIRNRVPKGQLTFIRNPNDMNDAPPKDWAPLRCLEPHVLLSKDLTGQGIPTFLYSMMLNQGYSLTTKSHTKDASVLWDRVSRVTNTPILLIRSGRSHLSKKFDLIRPEKDYGVNDAFKVLLGKGRLLDPAIFHDDRGTG